MKNAYFENKTNDVSCFLNVPSTKKYDVHPHWHEDIEILCYLKGCARQQTGQNIAMAQAGDIAVIGKNKVHSVFSLPDDDCEILVLQFKTDGYLAAKTAKGMKKISKIEHANCIIRSSEAKEMIVSIKKTLDDELKTKAAIYTLVDLLGTIIPDSPLDDLSSQEANMLKNTFTLIDENYCKNITLSQAASASNLSVTHFNRLFKKATGMTFKNYLNFYRVNRADECLMQHMSVTQTAMELGFGSIGSFIRNYKKFKKNTPHKAIADRF